VPGEAKSELLARPPVCYNKRRKKILKGGGDMTNADLERELLRLEEEQAAAFNRRDVAAALASFSPEIVGFSSTRHERVSGLQALRETFEYYLRQAERIEYQISEPLVQAFGETAIVSFYWTVTLSNGIHRREVHGRGTHVFHRMNGQWRIVHEHFSRAHHRPEGETG
jgi:ketosteroid isomerase-like protein